VGYWRLNEQTGPQVADSSPNHLSGIATAGVAFGQGRLTLSDPTANSCAFSSGYIYLVENAAFDLGDNLTVMALVNIPSQGSGQGIVSKGANGYYLRTISGNYVDILKDRTADLGSTSPTAFAYGIHHFAWTKAGSANQIYIDGVDWTGSISNSTLANTSITLKIGADDDGSGGATEYFVGQMAEVALFSAALTPIQVKAIAALALT
jgi:hypothetical protein